MEAKQEAQELAVKAREEDEKKRKLLGEENEQRIKEHVKRLSAKSKKDQKIKGNSVLIQYIGLYCIHAILAIPARVTFGPMKVDRMMIRNEQSLKCLIISGF